MGFVQNEEDVSNLQGQLDSIYEWADQNNMCWNDLKFQLLRIGKNENLKLDTVLFSPGMREIIERKDCIKDLGVLVDENLKYSEHIKKSNCQN